MNHPNGNLWESLFQLLDSYTVDDFLSKEKESLIIAGMVQAGFKQDEAKAIFHWMKDLRRLMDEIDDAEKIVEKPKSQSIRVYTPEENDSFSPEAKICLKALEDAQVIDVNLREQIIDQAMTFIDDVIDVADLKWIIFPLLFKGASRISSEKQLLAVLMLSDDKTVKH